MMIPNNLSVFKQVESSSFVAILCSFHSFFKVLFTFPSQYLCAIGIFLIFSLRNVTIFYSLKLQSQTTRLCRVSFQVLLKKGNDLREFHSIS